LSSNFAFVAFDDWERVSPVAVGKLPMLAEAGERPRMPSALAPTAATNARSTFGVFEAFLKSSGRFGTLSRDMMISVPDPVNVASIYTDCPI